MGQLGRRRAQLDAERAGALLFPQHTGCAGTRHPRDDATPHPCVAEPTATVAHRYEYPRPRTERLFVCEAHAIGHPDPRPLTDKDRATLRRRRATYRRPPGLRTNEARGNV
jgi:hypothetical protein